MSDFENFLIQTEADQAAIRKQKSDEFQERINSQNQAAQMAVQSIMNAFASEGRFGNYFRPHDNPPGKTLGDQFDFTMAGKDLVLYFKGRVMLTDASPTGLAPVATFRVARRMSSTATGPEHNVQLDVKTNGAIIPVGLYDAVTGATASFVKNSR